MSSQNVVIVIYCTSSYSFQPWIQLQFYSRFLLYNFAHPDVNTKPATDLSLILMYLFPFQSRQQLLIDVITTSSFKVPAISTAQGLFLDVDIESQKDNNIWQITYLKRKDSGYNNNIARSATTRNSWKKEKEVHGFE